MLVGEVFGKTGTQEFKFKSSNEVKKMDFVVVDHNGKWVMSRIDNIECHPDGSVVCHCNVIGARESGLLKMPKTPIKPESLVYSADAEQIKETLNLDDDGIFLGRLEANYDVPIHLDVESLISKHIAVLASTGSGKSYTVGVILEDLLEKNLPVLSID